MNYKVVLGILGAAIVVGGIIFFITRDESIKSSEESERDGKKGTDVVTYTSVTEDENQSSRNNERTARGSTKGNEKVGR